MLDESDLVESDVELSLDPVPLWCFLVECFLVVVVVVLEVSLEPDPVDPLMPLGELDEELLSPLIPLEEPLLPVPVPLLVPDPIDDPPMLPEPLEPVPVEVPGALPVPLEVSEPVDELPVPIDELPELELLEGLLDPVDELPDWSELLAAPFVMMSSVWTLSVSPEPEKLARTRSPSLMSSMEAREPSFITCVLESTLSFLSLPERVSSFFERSKFWTRPLSVSK